MPPVLLVSVDTEEEFDWAAPFSSDSRSVTHTEELPRVQEVFEELGVRPTYLVDHPIATSEQSVRILAEFLARDACEIGAHLHPWVNPPITEEVCPRNSYLCNLPLPLQEEKLAVLTEAIAKSFGRRPTSFKAGRYGFDDLLVPSLAKQRYRLDSSVMAFADLRGDGGPDFRSYGPEPFLLQGSGSDGSALLEIPCTAGFNRRPFRRFARLHNNLSQSPWHRLRCIGVLNRLGLLRKTVLTPEGFETTDLIELMRVMARDADGVVFNLTFHSPSVQPGHTPYVRDTKERHLFLQKLRAVLQFAVRDLGAVSMTLSEYAARRQEAES